MLRSTKKHSNSKVHRFVDVLRVTKTHTRTNERVHPPAFLFRLRSMLSLRCICILLNHIFKVYTTINNFLNHPPFVFEGQETILALLALRAYSLWSLLGATRVSCYPWMPPPFFFSRADSARTPAGYKKVCVCGEFFSRADSARPPAGYKKGVRVCGVFFFTHRHNLFFV